MFRRVLRDCTARALPRAARSGRHGPFGARNDKSGSLPLPEERNDKSGSASLPCHCGERRGRDYGLGPKALSPSLGLLQNTIMSTTPATGMSSSSTGVHERPVSCRRRTHSVRLGSSSAPAISSVSTAETDGTSEPSSQPRPPEFRARRAAAEVRVVQEKAADGRRRPDGAHGGRSGLRLRGGRLVERHMARGRQVVLHRGLRPGLRLALRRRLRLRSRRRKDVYGAVG